MTPIGKLSVATLVLGSAFFTAKYLHRVAPEPARPSPRPESTRRPLSWQARSIQETAAPGLTALAQTPPALSGSEASHSAAKKPTAFNSKVAFAALSNANANAPAAAITAPPTGESPSEILPPLPAPAPQTALEFAARPASNATPQEAISVLQTDPANPQTPGERRWPIPLALGPPNELSQVQRHETVPATATDDFVEYTVQFGDSLPLLASRFLGDRDAYMSIYIANLDVLSSPADVAPGLILKIPARR